MAKLYNELTQNHIDFIKEQKIFFISSCSNHEVNISGRGYDTFRVLDNNYILLADYPGSGNRTARDIKEGAKITLLFTSFNEKPLNLKLFCNGELIEKDEDKWDKYFINFPHLDSNLLKRLMLFKIIKAETSCGYGTPNFEYKGKRENLDNWATKMYKEKTLDEYISNQDVPPNLGI
jgi:hypothetical protein